jgi:hypothetical protein
MEEVAVDRTDDTWYGGISVRLKPLGTEVAYLVSDWAKALVTLAHTGLGYLSIPEMFPLRHALATGYALALFGRLRQAQQAQVSVEAVQHCQEVRSAFREHLANLARVRHPWWRTDATRQTSQDVQRQ